MKIPFNDLKRQYKSLENPIKEAMSQCLESGWYILGEEVRRFEQNFAAYNDSNFCVGVASGTDAIKLALLALGVKPGMEVIVPCMTAYPTVTAVEEIGALPVAVDINLADGLINPDELKKAINSKTGAIVAVHLYGQVCDMDSISAIARSAEVPLVEDCAQATGAVQNGKKAGNFGDASCFSFYPTKNLGGVGDGGAVVTSSKETFEVLKQLRNYGQTSRYRHAIRGVNSRLDEIQAAVLSVKLRHLDEWNVRRAQIGEYYCSRLPSRILLKRKAGDCYHLFPIALAERDEFINFMNENGVGALIHYPLPVHMQGAFTGRSASCSNGENLAKKLVSLPLYPELTDDEVRTVTDLTLDFLNNHED